MSVLERFFQDAANFIWGTPLLILLLGGGVFFMFYSRFLPFRYFGHAINVLRGKYDDPSDPGDINHFQALSGALAATIGMGNISGVAVAIAMGGPGAIFWMWVSAFFGMATKFFTCTLSVMYRGKDSAGNLQGGPMYYIREGLGKKWMPLASFFAVVGFFGATPIFQANQIVQATKDILFVPNGIALDNIYLDLGLGVFIAILVGLVIFGGITRIGSVAGKLVPSMVLLYVASVIIILIVNYGEVWSSLGLIFTDAFTANSVLGGAVGALIITGARRAAFSNEAGIGTAPMMHGAAKTKEPVREGLVAMLGPAIDTLVICTMTGLCILVTGAWKSGDLNGISLTAKAFGDSLPGVGPYILALCVLIFAFTTLFGFAYYGQKCLSFLIGARYASLFNYWYVFLILVGSVATLQGVVAFIDVAYGLMAFPTMIGTIVLAPKALKAAKVYFSGVKTSG
ncbi:alanine/glycine:cation symporter family protein [Marinoscillum luteum]|uniref:Alanine/glycine:cation symporter family protein n=1 Tax=Marinoscillum luteum TaxID=861051 RepID=A0ABW7N6F0_9BACT